MAKEKSADGGNSGSTSSPEAFRSSGFGHIVIIAVLLVGLSAMTAFLLDTPSSPTASTAKMSTQSSLDSCVGNCDDASAQGNQAQEEDESEVPQKDPSSMVQSVDPATWMMDANAAWIDVCVQACAEGHDEEDARQLEEMGGSADAIDVCIIRCRFKVKEPTERGYVAEKHAVSEAFQKPSAVFQEYLEWAIRCSPGPSLTLSQGHAEALSTLASCGVVHLRDVFPVKLLNDLAAAVAQLRQQGSFGGIDLSHLDDIGALRAGREQIWLPFMPPFSSHELLMALPLQKLIKAYFDEHSGQAGGRRTVLQHATSIVAKATVAKDQELHTDGEPPCPLASLRITASPSPSSVKHPGRHLELHIPLKAVSANMGPTRMCPCSHGGHLNVDGKNATEVRLKRLLVRKLHSKVTAEDEDTCERFSNTHYDVTSQLGEVKMYDSAMFHRGLANTGSVDRPIIVLAFASSIEEATERNYTGHLESELDTAKQEMNKFRANFDELNDLDPLRVQVEESTLEEEEDEDVGFL